MNCNKKIPQPLLDWRVFLLVIALVPSVNHLGNNIGYCHYNKDCSEFHRLILQMRREVLWHSHQP